ncbi:MAG: type II secretion system minor pseudopilin GspJ [Pseudomonadota bacterium]
MTSFRTPLRRRRAAGFTLLETLVAISIFAVVAFAATAILFAAASNREAIGGALDRTKELQIARAIIGADLAQPTYRTVRDQNRGAPNYQGGEDLFVNGVDRETGDVRLVLTRRGRSNPGRVEMRGSLERVRYVLEDGALSRVSRTRLDSARDTPEAARVLVGDLRDARFEFFDGLAWRTAWPFRTGTGALGSVINAPPRATALHLDFENGRSVRLLFYSGDFAQL